MINEKILINYCELIDCNQSYSLRCDLFCICFDECFNNFCDFIVDSNLNEKI